jgi:uncharacterized protein
MDGLTRRHLIQRAALASGALALGPAFWQRAAASAATVTDGPYGPLGPPNELGIRLPAGFQARLVARGLETVPGTSYVLPVQPDGQTTFARPDGGWILVTNAEAPPPAGGASAIQFTPAGEVEDAYRILSGTTLNCAGGRTPWGTWLSGEEVDESEYDGGPFPPGTSLPANPFRGAIWECDPTQAGQGVRRPALGLFKHEAACVDPVGQHVYLTEDLEDGCFYRFTPESYPDLAAGVLEVAIVAADGSVTWAAVPNPQPPPGTTPTREQVEGATRFERGEGIWFDSGVVYVATTRDSKLHAYDTVTQRHSVLYDGKAQTDGPLTDPDNITVSPSGDLLVCENTDGSDGGLDIALLTPDLTISRFLRVEGEKHIYDAPELGPSELCGVVFDPSGTRMYFTSQRAREQGGGDEPGPGEIYEVTGPFRTERPRTGPLSPGNPREVGQSIGPGQSRDGARLVGPALGIEVPRRIAWRTFHERGLPVALTLASPATVRVAVSARFTPGETRRRGPRRLVAVARAGRRYHSSGPRLLRLKADRRVRRLMAGRRSALRLRVRVTVDGESVERTTVLAPPRRRPRRRRRRGR